MSPLAAQLGTGTGTFAAKTDYTTGTNPLSVAIADVNGDGIPDLVFQNSAGQIYRWLLDGSGNAINFTTGTGLKPGSGFLYGGGLGDWRIR